MPELIEAKESPPVEFDLATVRHLAGCVDAAAALARQAAGHIIEATGGDDPAGIDTVGALFHATLPLDDCRRALRPYHRIRPLVVTAAAGLAALSLADLADAWLDGAAWYGGPFLAAGMVAAYGAVHRFPRPAPHPPTTRANGELHRADIALRGALHALCLARESIPEPPYPAPLTARQRRHTRAAAYLQVADPILRRAEHHLNGLLG